MLEVKHTLECHPSGNRENKQTRKQIKKRNAFECACNSSATMTRRKRGGFLQIRSASERNGNGAIIVVVGVENSIFVVWITRSESIEIIYI